MASRSALVTVLFTDIVGSTQIAQELGDRRWRELLSRHHRIVRRELRRFRGREIDTAGDGFFAAFQRPEDAVRAAAAITEGVRALGIEVRAGVHAGQVEIMGRTYGGVAVHVGARIGSAAEPGEVLVSGTLRELLPGASLVFEDRSLQPLKGLAEPQRLYSVSAVDGRSPPPPLGEAEAIARRKRITPPAPRRRRPRVAAAVAAAVAVAATLTVILTRPDRPAPGPASPGEVRGAVVRIDGDSGRVDPPISGISITRRQLLAPFSPQVAVGEGGVWVIAQRGLFHVDQESATLTRLDVSFGLGLGVGMTIGLHEVWVSDPGRDQLLGIAPATLEVAEEFEIQARGGFGQSLAVAGGHVWVGSGQALIRVDPDEGTLREFVVEGTVDEVVPVGDSLWIVDQLAGVLARFDTETGRVVRTIELQTVTPDEVVADDEGSLWILDQFARAVTEVTPSGEVRGPIPAGRDPTAIAAGEGAVWVTDAEQRAVLRIDPGFREIDETIPVGGAASALAVDPATGDVWVYLS